MCGGVIPHTLPVVPHEEVDADNWRGRPNPRIHSEISMQRPSVLASTERTQCQEDLSFLLPQIEVDMNHNSPPWKNENTFKGVYPINLYEWRGPGPICAEAIDFHRKVQREFSEEVMRDVVKAGNALVHLTRGLEDALFSFQEHEFRLLEPQIAYIKDNQRWIPQLSEEMIEAMRVVATASYTRPPP